MRQEPRLYGQGADFPIVYLSEQTPKALAAPKLGAYPEVLKTAWKNRDDAWDDAAFQKAPRQLRKFEASLVRLGDRWRHGWAPVKTLDVDTQNFAHELAQVLRTPRPVYRSLALEEVKPSPAFAEAIYQTLIQEPDPKKTPADHLKKLGGEILARLKEDKKVEFPLQAAAALEALTRVKQPEPYHFQAASAALSALRAKPAYTEILYLQRLADFAREEYFDTWPRDKVVAAWQTMRAQQAVLAALASDPEALPWVAGDIAAADAQRRAGERKFFRERPSTWGEAYAKLQGANEVYERVRKSLEAMHQARSELDRALARLPAYADQICAWPDEDFAAERLVQRRGGGAGRAKILQQPADTRPALNQHTRQLKESLDELEETIDLRSRAAVKDATGAAPAVAVPAGRPAAQIRQTDGTGRTAAHPGREASGGHRQAGSGRQRRQTHAASG